MRNTPYLLAGLACLFIVGCQFQYSLAPARDEVTLQLKRMHQPEFAGFYVAQEKGYYARENIKVNFMEAERDRAIIPRVIYGQADFAVISPESTLIAAGQGDFLPAIAVIYRESPVVYVSKSDSGIIRPRDFIGKTVATLDASGSQKDLEVQFHIMMMKQGLDTTLIKIVPWDSEYVAFYKGDVDVTSCLAAADLIRMRQKGRKLNLIWPVEYGAHFYSDSLVTTEKLIEERPELVTRFLRATLRGWQDVIENDRQAAEITLKYTGDKDIQLVTAMMEAQVPLVHTGEDHIGWMKPEVWQQMYDELQEQRLLDKPYDVKKLYDLKFLQEIYGSATK